MAKIGSKVSGVVVAISHDVRRSHYIGDCGISLDVYSGPQVGITGVRMPVSMKGHLIGFIMSYRLSDGRIRFDAEMRDTPEVRRALRIDEAIGKPLSKMIDGREKGKAKRSKR